MGSEPLGPAARGRDSGGACPARLSHAGEPRGPEPPQPAPGGDAPLPPCGAHPGRTTRKSKIRAPNDDTPLGFRDAVPLTDAIAALAHEHWPFTSSLTGIPPARRC